MDNGIDKELKKFSFAKFKMNKILIYLSHLIVPLLPKCINKKKIKFTKVKIKGIKHYVFTPKEYSEQAIIYYIHGGGFTTNMYTTHFKLIQEYSSKCKLKVLAIKYSLAPRNKYPSQINEIITSLKEIAKDYKRIILMGDSAGGSLVIDSITNLEDVGIKIKDLVLVYPVVSIRQDSESMREYTHSPLWNSRSNELMWKLYNDGSYKDVFNKIHLYNLDNLYVEVCEIDCLKDEGIKFYDSVKCKNKYLRVNNGCYHGFEICYNSKVCKEAINERINFINKIL